MILNKEIYGHIILFLKRIHMILINKQIKIMK